MLARQSSADAYALGLLRPWGKSSVMSSQTTRTDSGVWPPGRDSTCRAATWRSTGETVRRSKLSAGSSRTSRAY